MSIPLILSQAEQDWLANVCQTAASIRHKYENQKPIDFAEIGAEFVQHIVDGNLQTDNCFSRLYDALHRSGANG
jgi:hypothetical protein